MVRRSAGGSSSRCRAASILRGRWLAPSARRQFVAGRIVRHRRGGRPHRGSPRAVGVGDELSQIVELAVHVATPADRACWLRSRRSRRRGWTRRRPMLPEGAEPLVAVAPRSGGSSSQAAQTQPLRTAVGGRSILPLTCSSLPFSSTGGTPRSRSCNCIEEARVAIVGDERLCRRGRSGRCGGGRRRGGRRRVAKRRERRDSRVGRRPSAPSVRCAWSMETLGINGPAVVARIRERRMVCRSLRPGPRHLQSCVGGLRGVSGEV